jgi:hypothetical protein
MTIKEAHIERFKFVENYLCMRASRRLAAVFTEISRVSVWALLANVGMAT